MASPPPLIRFNALADNARGLALAAFGDLNLIQALLGADRLEAERFQRVALDHWHGLMAEAKRARR